MKVLVEGEDYQRLSGDSMSLREALEQRGDGDFAFEPERIEGPMSLPADLD